jgi:chorismate lyase/3-hydroxybenzoate synthase
LSGELPAAAPVPPRWVGLLFDRAATTTVSGGVQIIRTDTISQLSITVAGARRLPVEQLRGAVSDAYVALGSALRDLSHHPCRFWNFIPDPNGWMGPGLDRYMVFNSGRYEAFAGWYGTAQAFGQRLATGSAVGREGDDLTIVCLGGAAAGTPVENPRQTPSWRYSSKYGPRPPCFARGTVVTLGEHRLALIGGTASIVGERSMHPGDLDAQIDETFANLQAVIAAARGRDTPEPGELDRLSDLRVYVPRPGDASAIRARLDARCSGVSHLEMCRSQLCRPELLVEIEGIAIL